LQLLERSYKRVVIKIGSSLFWSAENKPDSTILEGICCQVTTAIGDGKKIIIVSSGAIALGMDLMNLKSRPKELPTLQAIAAIGQNALMNNYSRAFQKYGINSSQILLTWDDFNDRKRYLNAKNTLLTLLKIGSIPIVNENDTVSTDEIKFGDNDRLSALLAALINADLLVILSDVEGLLDKDKKVIRVVDEITPQIKTFACPTNKKTSVGGMVSKIEAAKITVDSGIPCVIADGRQRNIILSVINQPAKFGSLFLPKKGFAERERWIAFGSKPKGKLVVDEGAQKALMNKKSLLCVGIIGSENIFESGDIVSIVDKEGNEFARGKVGISSKKLEEIKGRRFDKEIIHRDNIVIL
jgi:glutamate 5-kinase